LRSWSLPEEDDGLLVHCMPLSAITSNPNGPTLHESDEEVSLGLGIWFFLKFRFGFSVLKNFGFLDIRNQSVF
jgi:hypothetical protein